MEVLGSCLLMASLYRGNYSLEIDLSHRLFEGLRYWLAPTDQDVERTKAPKNKRAKQAPRDKSFEEKLELLGLRQGTIPRALLHAYPPWPALDAIIMALLLSTFVTGWQELFWVAHQGGTSVRLGSIVVASSAVLTLAVLIRLALDRRRSLDSDRYWALMGAAVGGLVGAVVLALPSHYTTFDFDTALTDARAQCHACIALIGLEGSGPCVLLNGASVRLLLALTAAAIGAALAPSAVLASTFTWPRVPLPHESWRLPLRVADPLLSSLLVASYVRPLLFDWVKRATTVPLTDARWAALQTALLCVVLACRALPLRFQLQAYLEVGGLQALFAEMNKKRDMQAAELRPVFTTRVSWLVLTGLRLAGPLVFLALLVLMQAQKLILPPLSARLLHALAPTAVPLNRPLANGTLVEIISRTPFEANEFMASVQSVWGCPYVTPGFYREVVGFLICWSTAVWLALNVLAVFWRALSMAGPQLHVKSL